MVVQQRVCRNRAPIDIFLAARPSGKRSHFSWVYEHNPYISLT